MEEAIALDSIQAIAASFGASFDAEKIVDSVLEKDGTRYYKVRWVKYSWEPAASFTHLEHLITAYWSQYGQTNISEKERTSDVQKILMDENSSQQHHQNALNDHGKAVPSLLNSINPIVASFEQVPNTNATPVNIDIQQQNLQIAQSFQHLHTINQVNQQQPLDIIPNMQSIPINLQHQPPPLAPPLPQPQQQQHKNPGRKTRKARTPKDTSQPPKKRRKIPGTCDICGKQFKSTTNIAAHKKLHTEERKFTCEQCGNKFRRKLHLKRHLESHAGIKSFSCNICGSAFSSKWYMEAHKVVHTGEKPYECELCKKRFNNKANLNKHKLIHGNKRPYVCNECGQSYRQSFDLKRHMSTHTETKTYNCNQCDKTFARKTYLQRHMLTHGAERKFACTVCSRVFLQRGQLNFHMKQQHNKTCTVSIETEHTVPNKTNEEILDKDTDILIVHGQENENEGDRKRNQASTSIDVSAHSSQLTDNQIQTIKNSNNQYQEQRLQMHTKQAETSILQKQNSGSHVRQDEYITEDREEFVEVVIRHKDSTTAHFPIDHNNYFQKSKSAVVSTSHNVPEAPVISGHFTSLESNYVAPENSSKKNVVLGLKVIENSIDTVSDTARLLSTNNSTGIMSSDAVKGFSDSSISNATTSTGIMSLEENMQSKGLVTHSDENNATVCLFSAADTTCVTSENFVLNMNDHAINQQQEDT